MKRKEMQAWVDPDTKNVVLYLEKDEIGSFTKVFGVRRARALMEYLERYLEWIKNS